MKKIAVLCILLCAFGFTKANPIACPPVISEFYLVDNSHWYLELIFRKDNMCWKPTTLDGCKITTSTGTFSFKNGINVTWDSILVITQDSLVGMLQINRSGDVIMIKDASNNQMDLLSFGNASNARILAPRKGQSIVNYRYECWNYEQSKPDVQYILIKDNHPTIGFNGFRPYELAKNTIGTFTGIVYDKAHHPVPGIHIGDWHYTVPIIVCENYFKSTVSDSDGKFSIPEYSGRHYAYVFFQSPRWLYQSTINIEPDSMNYYEFTIDTALTGINSSSFQKNIALTCFPNPSTGETTISFTIPDNNYTKALIKIYNSVGEMICILPVHSGNSQKNYVVKWDGSYLNKPVASGIYNCNLELDGQQIATNKIIIAK